MAQSARERARENARRRAEEQTHGGGGFSISLPDGVKFLENKDGKKLELDILPYIISDSRNPDVRAGRAKVGDWSDVRLYYQHSNIGPDQKRVVCLKTIGKPCPVCEEIEVMRKNVHVDPKEIEAIKQKERALYNVIDLNEKGSPIRVWDVSYYLFTRKLENDQKDRDERYDYFLLEGGLTLSIRFEKKSMGKGNPFYEADRIDYDRRENYDEKILDEVVDLDKALNIMEYAQLKKLMMGAADEPDGEDTPDKNADKNETPARGDRSRGRARDEEQEPEKKPARERGKREPEQGPEERTHRRAPDEPGERERHEDDYKNELEECPGKKSNGKAGVFGDDCDKLDYCDRGNGGKGCDKWDDCRKEKSRREKEGAAEPKGRGKKEADPEPEEKPSRSARGGERQGKVIKTC